LHQPLGNAWFDASTWGNGPNAVNGPRLVVVDGSNPTGTILNPKNFNQAQTTLMAANVILSEGVHEFTLLYASGVPEGLGPWEPISVRLFLVPTVNGPTTTFIVGTQPTNPLSGPASQTETVGLTSVTVEYLGHGQPIGEMNGGVNRVAQCCSQPDGAWDHIARVRVTVVNPDAAPDADAGGSYSVDQDQPVTLDGTASSDDNGPVTYAWAVASAPEGSNGGALLNATSATPSFTPDIPGDYTLTLTVTDGIGQTDADTATVSSINAAPIPHAGPSLGTYVGAIVPLDGSLSHDPNGDPITFAWSLQGPAGSTATLINAASAEATFVPDLPGQYTATNTVTDVWGASNQASVIVSVATPGAYAEEQTGSAVTQVSTLPPTSVTSAGNQSALGNFLHQTVQALQANNTAQAISKLESAIARTDGCALRGAPDGNGPGRDWVTDCAAQLQLYADLTAALAAIQP
jgi:hypothetical protein